MTANTALQRVSGKALTLASQMGMTEEYVQLVKNSVAQDTTDTELMHFLQICQNANLNPMNNEIYCWKQYDKAIKKKKLIIHTGIKGFRLAADRTGCYVPGPETEFKYDDNGKLVSATAHVMKKVGQEWMTVSFTAKLSTFQRDTFIWKSQYKEHQLAVAAERHALQRAFPQLAPIIETEIAESRNGAANSDEPTAFEESDEDKATRERLTDCLLNVGKTILNKNQLATLQSRLPNTPISSLKAKVQTAENTMREKILAEAEKHLKVNAKAFVTAQFPKGIEFAGCSELIDALDQVKIWEPPKQIDINPDEVKLQELREVADELLENVTGGDEVEKTKILGQREINELDEAGLVALNEELRLM